MRAVQREAIERTHRFLHRLLGNEQVLGCGLNAGVAQQNLNAAQIDAVFQQVGSEAVTKGLLVMLMIRTQRRSAIAITRSMA
jgi:hypothetical protein